MSQLQKPRVLLRKLRLLQVKPRLQEIELKNLLSFHASLLKLLKVMQTFLTIMFHLNSWLSLKLKKRLRRASLKKKGILTRKLLKLWLLLKLKLAASSKACQEKKNLRLMTHTTKNIQKSSYLTRRALWFVKLLGLNTTRARVNLNKFFVVKTSRKVMEHLTKLHIRDILLITSMLTTKMVQQLEQIQLQRLTSRRLKRCSMLIWTRLKKKRSRHSVKHKQLLNGTRTTKTDKSLMVWMKQSELDLWLKLLWNTKKINKSARMVQSTTMLLPRLTLSLQNSLKNEKLSVQASSQEETRNVQSIWQKHLSLMTKQKLMLQKSKKSTTQNMMLLETHKLLAA